MCLIDLRFLLETTLPITLVVRLVIGVILKGKEEFFLFLVYRLENAAHDGA